MSDLVYTPECEAWLRSLGLQIMDLAMERMNRGEECPPPMEAEVWQVVKTWSSKRPHNFVEVGTSPPS